MLQRFQGLLLLIALALALPRADAAWSWCLHDQRIFAPGEDCCIAVLETSGGDCGCHEKENPRGCMVDAGKVLPDAVLFKGSTLPGVGLAGLALNPSRGGELVPAVSCMAAPVVPRGPPPPGCPLFRMWSVVRC